MCSTIYITYGIEVWCNTFNNYTDTLLKLQKKVIINFIHYCVHETTIFLNNKILRFEALKEAYKITSIFKLYTGKASASITNLVITNEDT